MFQAAAEPWWKHSFETFIGAGIPVILWMLENRRRAVKAAAEAQDKIKKELDSKHKENTERLNHQDEKLDKILEREKYLPPHMHRELNGPLCAENIHYPQKG